MVDVHAGLHVGSGPIAVNMQEKKCMGRSLTPFLPIAQKAETATTHHTNSSNDGNVNNEVSPSRQDDETAAKDKIMDQSKEKESAITRGAA